MRKASKKQKREDWRRQWREQCRRQLERPTLARIKYGFAWVYKPVLDDGPSRAFDTMEEYRRWCRAKLPRYLGYWPASRAHAAK